MRRSIDKLTSEPTPQIFVPNRDLMGRTMLKSGFPINLPEPAQVTSRQFKSHCELLLTQSHSQPAGLYPVGKHVRRLLIW